MKEIASLFVFLVLLPVQVLAATELDRCLEEQKKLRGEEKENCSGLRYVLNPSGCFASQKALQAFRDGRCSGIIGSSKSEPAAVPTPAPPPAPMAAPAPVAAPVPPRATPAAPAREPVNAAGQGCEGLREENVRLKAEIDRLRGEIEQLKKR